MLFYLFSNRALSALLNLTIIGTGAFIVAVCMAPSASAANSPATQHQGATYAARQAVALYDYLTQGPASPQAKASNEPIGYLPRIRTAPAEIRTAIGPASLKAARGTQVDADSLVLFWTGASHNAACLDLRNGAVTRGTCAQPTADSASAQRTSSAAPSLVRVYKQFIRSAIWFDRHHATTGLGVRDVTLMQMLASEFADVATLTFNDSDADGTVDGSGDNDATITLTATAGSECGHVDLPQSQPDRGNYAARFAFC